MKIKLKISPMNFLLHFWIKLFSKSTFTAFQSMLAVWYWKMSEFQGNQCLFPHHIYFWLLENCKIITYIRNEIQTGFFDFWTNHILYLNIFTIGDSHSACNLWSSGLHMPRFDKGCEWATNRLKRAFTFSWSYRVFFYIRPKLLSHSGKRTFFTIHFVSK